MPRARRSEVTDRPGATGADIESASVRADIEATVLLAATFAYVLTALLFVAHVLA